MRIGKVGQGALALPVWLLVFWLAFTFMGNAAHAAPEAAVLEVRIGVLAKQGDEEALGAWKPTADYLTQSVPGYLFKIVPLGFKDIDVAVAQGSVHFVIVNPGMYVEFESLYHAERIATLKNLRQGKSYTEFGGVIVKKSSRHDIHDLEDLKDKKFMAVDESSLGGWQAAWREIKEAGVDPYSDLKLSFVGTHDAVIEAVRAGTVDAGTVRTDTLEALENKGKLPPGELSVLNQQRSLANFPFVRSTRLYPEWAFAALRSAPDGVAGPVAVALLNMPMESPAARAAKSAGWTIPLNYEPVRELFKELRLGPYKDYGRITWSALFLQYGGWALAALLAMVLLSMAAIRFYRMARHLRKVSADLETELEVRKYIEAQLELLSRQNKQILHAVAEGVCGIDRNGKTIFVNPSAAEMLGYEPGELIGEPLHERTHHSHADGSPFPKYECPITHVLVDGVALGGIEDCFWTKNGNPIQIEASATPMGEPGGEVEGAVVTFRDIGPRKAAEAELHRLKEAAENANQAKSAFLADMSHELRTPLNAILGFAQLLEAETDPALTVDQLESLTEILKAGQHLLELIDEVLNLAKIEAGKLDLTIESVDVAMVVADCLSLIAPQASKHSIEVSSELAAENGGRVNADPLRLKQVLLNLLSNAVKFNRPGGTVQIRADVQRGRVALSVADTGRGLMPQELEKLFTPFARFGDTAAVQGTGLGLALTRNLVERMGGSIRVESRVGEGTVFTVELGAGKEPDNAEPAGTEPNPGAAPVQEYAPISILYIEDNPANRSLIGKWARKKGWHIDFADGGEQGIKLAATLKPDMILLDINLSDGVSGLDVKAALAEIEGSSHVPVIGLSGHAMPEDVERAMNAGFSAYLKKPVNLEQLELAVLQATGKPAG